MDQHSNSMSLMVLGLMIFGALALIFMVAFPEVGQAVMDTFKSKISGI